MAHTIITKNSSTAGAVPSAGSLTKGELAVNVTDRRLYTKDNAGSVVEVGSGTSIIYRDNFTGDGSTVAFTLLRSPLNEELVDIYCDGVYQGKDTFSISGAVITFDEAPLAGASIEVMTFQSSPIGETAANYVSYLPSGSGSVSTTVQSKLRETVSVFDFMTAAQIADVSSGTGTIDVSAAINAAFAYVRSVTTYQLSLVFPAGRYLVNTSINATNIRASNDGGKRFIFGLGAEILGNCTGKPVFDFTRSLGWGIANLTVIGDTTNTPLCAFQLARGNSGESADNFLFQQVETKGSYSRAALYNFASERFAAIGCTFRNFITSASAWGLIVDGNNYYGATSDYYTITVPQYTSQSCMNQLFVSTTVGGGSAGSNCGGLHLIDCARIRAVASYLIARGGRPGVQFGVYNSNDFQSIDLEMHMEPSGGDVTYNYYFKNLGGTTSSCTVEGFRAIEKNFTGATGVFGSDLPGLVNLRDTQVSIPNKDASAVAVLFQSGTWNVQGDIFWGLTATTPPTGFNIAYMTGNITVQEDAGITLPTGGSYTLTLYKGANPEIRYYGTHALKGSVLNNGNTLIGYGQGSGGAVTQATSKSTAVTLNTSCGVITMSNAALGAGAYVTFTVNNSLVTGTDVVIAHRKSTGSTAAYEVFVDGVVNGSFNITVKNITAGSLSEALQINYAILNSINS